MNENFRVKLLGEPPKQPYDDIYFKIHCLYIAKTELYDRTLTDERDRYDSTSAYIANPWVRSHSNYYSSKLYRWCVYEIEKKTRKSFSSERWRESVRGYINMSAQWWIDYYNHLVEIGEYDEYEK